jgi:hypothetical protein
LVRYRLAGNISAHADKAGGGDPVADSDGAVGNHRLDLESGLTVVGIPTRNEAPTIAAVAAAADEGLAVACAPGQGVIVLADNGSTDGTVERFLETPLRARTAVVKSPGECTGKGTNVFALIDKSLALGAQRLVLLDGDVRSARPDWVGLLARASDGPGPRMVLPEYRRNRYEATSTNHLVRPLLAAAFGAYVQQPIGGDSASLYGIDVWLTANALRAGFDLIEVPLGRKVHNSPFPKILYLPQQVLDSLFHVIAEVGRLRPGQPADGREPAVDDVAVHQDPELILRINRSVNGYLDAHRADIDRLFPTAKTLAPASWGLRVTTDQWPHLLADSLQALADGELERSRDHLIALCVNRVMTFWTEIEGLGTPAVDELLERQTCETASAVAEREINFAAPPAPRPFTAGRWLEFQTRIAV